VDPPEIQLAPELLDRLAGKYEAGPNVIFVVRRRGDALGFQGPSSPSARLHAESPTRFFFTNADAAVTFELDPAGRATGLVLHLSGMPVPARRIDLVELER
jgi:hypothetical protein